MTPCNTISGVTLGPLRAKIFVLTGTSWLTMLVPTEAERCHMGLISILIGVLIIVVVGAICFWAIDKFAIDRRLSQLLKLLVVLVCLGAILQRVLALTY
jgi:tetrahydromethanopterin S-methyltransferase subunit E